MTDNQPQFDRARKEYLKQRFPGDLADVLPQHSASLDKRGFRLNDRFTTAQWLGFTVVAASIVLGLTIGLMQLLSGSPEISEGESVTVTVNTEGNESTPDASAPSKKRPSRPIIIGLSRSVVLDLSTRKAKARTIGLPNTRTRSQRIRSKRPSSLWPSMPRFKPTLASASKSNTAASPSPPSKKRKKLESRNSLRFQPLTIFNYRRT